MRTLPAVMLVLVGLTSAAAQADEPLRLTGEQMDQVSAGQFGVPGLGDIGDIDLGDFDWETEEGFSSLEVIGAVTGVVFGTLPPIGRGTLPSGTPTVATSP